MIVGIVHFNQEDDINVESNMKTFLLMQSDNDNWNTVLG